MNDYTTSLLTNPLREGQRLQAPVGNCAIVIFGASGDLTARKLMSALFNLARRQIRVHLPPNVAHLPVEIAVGYSPR